MSENPAPESLENLDRLSFEALCARFHLHPHEDGSWQHAASDTHGRLIALPVGEILPWQKCAAPLMIRHIAGAPLALSRSPDGHSADAVHLQNGTSGDIAADCWHTAESLGHWSLFDITGEGDYERAADDWFPTPMAKPQGMS